MVAVVGVVVDAPALDTVAPTTTAPPADSVATATRIIPEYFMGVPFN
jgi:hypothetical protein